MPFSHARSFNLPRIDGKEETGGACGQSSTPVPLCIPSFIYLSSCIAGYTLSTEHVTVENTYCKSDTFRPYVEANPNRAKW